MPYINVTVSTDVTKEQEIALKSKLGQAISVFPGKSETYLMVNITPNCNLYLGGKNDTPIAMGELRLLGNADRKYCEKFTVEFCNILEEVLSVPQDKTYITYQGFEHWGYNGFNF